MKLHTRGSARAAIAGVGSGPEQIVRKLREGDRLLIEGKDITEALRALEVSESSWNCWRAHAAAPWLTTLVAVMHMNRDADSATAALLTASRALVAVAARSLADVDEVTLPQFRALVVLTVSAPVTVGDLAEALDIHPSTATRLCDRLVRKRLVRRQPGAAADRRETTVSLTARGSRLVDRVTARRRRDLAEIAAAMTPEDREHAVLGLSAFARAAGELPVQDPFGWVPTRDPAAASRG